MTDAILPYERSEYKVRFNVGNGGGSPLTKLVTIGYTRSVEIDSIGFGAWANVPIETLNVAVDGIPMLCARRVKQPGKIDLGVYDYLTDQYYRKYRKFSPKKLFNSLEPSDRKRLIDQMRPEVRSLLEGVLNKK